MTAILKSGFQPGFRGRKTAPTWNRRAHYLGAEHGRESALLIGSLGQHLSPAEAIQVLGGPNAEYHELIIAPSHAACRAIDGRDQADPSRAELEAGLRLAKAHATGRPFVLAVHRQSGRFHFHVDVQGAMPANTLGREGTLQRHWDRELFGQDVRIQDWAAHKRFLEIRSQLLDVVRAQRQNDRSRNSALRKTTGPRAWAFARPFERKARGLIEKRYHLEVRALEARYLARGTLGCARHQAELESCLHRRIGAVRRLDRRSAGRVMALVSRGSNRVMGKVRQQGFRTSGLVREGSRMAVDGVLRRVGAPRVVRVGARVALTVTNEAFKALLRTAVEAARASARSGMHVGKAALKIAVGLLGALPTKGGSLKTAGKESSKDLLEAGREFAVGGSRIGIALGSGAASTLAGGVGELIPRELNTLTRLGTTSIRTAAGAAQDLITLSPLGLAKTVVGGGTDLADLTTKAVKAQAPLPEPLRRAFQVAGWLPLVGPVAKALELATRVAHAALEAARGGMEIER